MSIPSKEQASEFLLPLKGRHSILMLHDAEVKLPLSSFILGCSRALSLETTIVDTDAFYRTNIEGLAAGEVSFPPGQVLLLPQPDFEVTPLLSLLSSKRGILVIDDLNSLHSLASDGRRSQQLAILFKLLSYNSRMSGSWVLSTAYRTELADGRGKPDQRQLTELGDLVIETELRGGSIHVRADLEGWPNGEYAL